MRRRKAREALQSGADRSIVSASEWRRPHVRFPLATAQVILLILLVIAGLLPILWLMKAAFTPTQDTLSQPLAIFPNGATLTNVAQAFGINIKIQDYFLNTIWVAAGAWAVQIVVSTTGGYALSVLKPKYGRIVTGMVIATLFLPAIVLLIPLYLTILHPLGFGGSLLNTFWAVWLPSGASAFNVVLVMRFFDSLPREIFEAAETDGAGPFRLFWSIVLPMSKPVIGVVTVFAIINTWKDFLWPNLVLPGGSDPASVQPLSVRLPAIQGTTEVGPYLASLAIATLIPIIMFLIFQRTFLNGGGFGGAVKG
ncbi:MAG TPA: carbohydrate ABC transporter permease [Galbitalea sp.]|nr:carbohydrate ABC transporter permease [Galbitalea sp.]